MRHARFRLFLQKRLGAENDRLTEWGEVLALFHYKGKNGGIKMGFHQIYCGKCWL